jgi:hypothetical protein
MSDFSAADDVQIILILRDDEAVFRDEPAELLENAVFSHLLAVEEQHACVEVFVP